MRSEGRREDSRLSPSLPFCCGRSGQGFAPSLAASRRTVQPRRALRPVSRCTRFGAAMLQRQGTDASRCVTSDRGPDRVFAIYQSPSSESRQSSNLCQRAGTGRRSCSWHKVKDAVCGLGGNVNIRAFVSGGRPCGAGNPVCFRLLLGEGFTVAQLSGPPARPFGLSL